MSNGILPLSVLSLKLPEAQQAHQEAMLQGPKRQIDILVMKTSMKI